jgi:hypothetical protein
LPSTRTTFIIDKAGIIRFVFIAVCSSNPLVDSICSAVLDATVNNGAHAKFVDKELGKLAAEEEVHSPLKAFSADVNASTYAIPAL